MTFQSSVRMPPPEFKPEPEKPKESGCMMVMGFLIGLIAAVIIGSLVK